MLLGAYTNLEQLVQLRLHGNRINLDRLLNSNAQHSGNRKSRLQGRGMEFDEVRAYEPGDDVRTIDWRVTARTGKAHTKLFIEERERPVLILLDQSPSMFFGSRKRFKSVAAAEAAALITWSATHQSNRVGGVLLGANTYVVLKPRNNRSAVLYFLNQIHACNEQLLKPYSNTQGPSLAVAIDRLRQINHNNALIFILSDFRVLERDSDALKQQLHPIAKYNDIVCLLVSDPLEARLPQRGHYRVMDDQGNRFIETGNKQANARYEARALDKEAKLGELCRALRMASFNLSTVNDVLEVFTGVLRSAR